MRPERRFAAVVTERGPGREARVRVARADDQVVLAGVRGAARREPDRRDEDDPPRMAPNHCLERRPHLHGGLAGKTALPSPRRGGVGARLTIRPRCVFRALVRDAGSGAQTCGSNPVGQTFNASLTYYQQTAGQQLRHALAFGRDVRRAVDQPLRRAFGLGLLRQMRPGERQDSARRGSVPAGDEPGAVLDQSPGPRPDGLSGRSGEPEPGHGLQQPGRLGQVRPLSGLGKYPLFVHELLAAVLPGARHPQCEVRDCEGRVPGSGQLRMDGHGRAPMGTRTSQSTARWCQTRSICASPTSGGTSSRTTACTGALAKRRRAAASSPRASDASERIARSGYPRSRSASRERGCVVEEGRVERPRIAPGDLADGGRAGHFADRAPARIDRPVPRRRPDGLACACDARACARATLDLGGSRGPACPGLRGTGPSPAGCLHAMNDGGSPCRIEPRRSRPR